MQYVKRLKATYKLNQNIPQNLNFQLSGIHLDVLDTTAQF